MMRKIPKYILIVATTVIFLLSSCSPGSCFEETNAYVKAKFFLTSTSKAAAPDSITLYGVGRENSYVYLKALKVSQALMPLDASAENCSLVLKINGVNDTISFTYSTYSKLISKECGYAFYHSIETPEYTKHIIDTVIVVKSTITTLSEQNISIYY
jgi:hypothetical protein